MLQQHLVHQSLIVSQSFDFVMGESSDLATLCLSHNSHPHLFSPFPVKNFAQQRPHYLDPMFDSHPLYDMSRVHPVQLWISPVLMARAKLFFHQLESALKDSIFARFLRLFAARCALPIYRSQQLQQHWSSQLMSQPQRPDVDDAILGSEFSALLSQISPSRTYWMTQIEAFQPFRWLTTGLFKELLDAAINNTTVQLPRVPVGCDPFSDLIPDENADLETSSTASTTNITTSTTSDSDVSTSLLSTMISTLLSCNDVPRYSLVLQHEDRDHMVRCVLSQLHAYNDPDVKLAQDRAKSKTKSTAPVATAAQPRHLRWPLAFKLIVRESLQTEQEHQLRGHDVEQSAVFTAMARSNKRKRGDESEVIKDPETPAQLVESMLTNLRQPYLYAVPSWSTVLQSLRVPMVQYASSPLSHCLQLLLDRADLYSQLHAVHCLRYAVFDHVIKQSPRAELDKVISEALRVCLLDQQTHCSVRISAAWALRDIAVITSFHKETALNEIPASVSLSDFIAGDVCFFVPKNILAHFFG